MKERPILSEQDLRERIELTRDLFLRKGWEYMKEGWEEELEALKDTTLTHATTLEELFFRKGAASVLDKLVNLPLYLDAVEKSLDEAKENGADA